MPSGLSFWRHVAERAERKGPDRPTRPGARTGESGSGRVRRRQLVQGPLAGRDSRPQWVGDRTGPNRTVSQRTDYEAQSPIWGGVLPRVTEGRLCTGDGHEGDEEAGGQAGQGRAGR